MSLWFGMLSKIAVIIYVLLFILILSKMGSSKKLGLLGIIVDERGKYSLSRFQALAWTFLIGAAYIGLSIKEGAFIEIHTTLLQLMGVSLGTAVVSQAIKTYKIDTQGTVDDVKTNQTITPKLIDMLSEEEKGFENQLSLGKFQMLVWTFISLSIYTIILLKSDGATLPGIDSTMVLLMGISQGTYLIHKIPA